VLTSTQDLEGFGIHDLGKAFDQLEKILRDLIRHPWKLRDFNFKFFPVNLFPCLRDWYAHRRCMRNKTISGGLKGHADVVEERVYGKRSERVEELHDKFAVAFMEGMLTSLVRNLKNWLTSEAGVYSLAMWTKQMIEELGGCVADNIGLSESVFGISGYIEGKLQNALPATVGGCTMMKYLGGFKCVDGEWSGDVIEAALDLVKRKRKELWDQERADAAAQLK
jgi:hypothetical protein